MRKAIKMARRGLAVAPGKIEHISSDSHPFMDMAPVIKAVHCADSWPSTACIRGRGMCRCCGALF